MLVDAFAEHWPYAWPDIDSGLREVEKSLDPDRICRVAVEGRGTVVGWIGAIREYQGHTWQLHPLLVRPDLQRRGIGRALVVDLEEQVRAEGGSSLYLGTDDTDGMTSLAGVDLYQDLPAHLANVRDLRGHPFRFYQKVGFSIVGVIPEANGPGKPDIMMAKRKSSAPKGRKS